MIYSTVTHNSGGNHGHQAEDLFNAIAYAELMGYEFLYKPYPYLDFLGLHNVYRSPNDVPDLAASTEHMLRGRHWFGMSYFQCFDWGFKEGAKFKNNPDRHLVVDQEQAFRMGVCNLIQWHQRGWVKEDLFSNLTQKWREAYLEHNKHRMTHLYNPLTRNVAIHIARGRDLNNRHRPSESHWTAYIFPMEYWLSLVEGLRELSGDTVFHIFTEGTNSEEIQAAFKGQSDVVLHLGPDRGEKNHEYIYDVLFHMVQSDVFVASNSGFSNMALYLRNDISCKSLYHSNVVMYDLPPARYKTTSLSGNF